MRTCLLIPPYTLRYYCIPILFKTILFLKHVHSDMDSETDNEPHKSHSLSYCDLKINFSTGNADCIVQIKRCGICDQKQLIM